jgi:hypothetical protein
MTTVQTPKPQTLNWFMKVSQLHEFSFLFILFEIPVYFNLKNGHKTFNNDITQLMRKLKIFSGIYFIDCPAICGRASSRNASFQSRKLI